MKNTIYLLQEANSGNCVDDNGTIYHITESSESVKEKSSSTTCHRTFQLPDGNKIKDLVADNMACSDVHHTIRSMYFDNIDDCLFEVQRQKEVPIGSSFQAKVPNWTGWPSVSADSADELKWLGTRLWPPEGHAIVY